MKISWADHVKSEVVRSVKEERNILHKIKQRKANCVGQILRKNCLLKHVSEGKIDRRIKVKRRRRRHKQLLDYLNETRTYCNLKKGIALFGELTFEEATDLP